MDGNLNTAQSINLTLEPDNPEFLSNLCGQLDEHLKLIEQRLNIEIRNRGNNFQLLGNLNVIQVVSDMLQDLYGEAQRGELLTPDQVHLYLQQSGIEQMQQSDDCDKEVVIRTKKALIKPRGPNQQKYVRSILRQDINFGIGPAGTGKTYLAVACAVDALEREEIDRILLVRPAVEAGERLGFLPGDLSQKVDPYLRPLYDALYEMLGFERVGKRLSDSLAGADRAEIKARRQAGEFIHQATREPILAITGDTSIDGLVAHPEVMAAPRLVVEATFLDDRVTPERAAAFGHIHLDELAALADRLTCEHLLINHVSAHHSPSEARRLVEERLPAELAARTQVMVSRIRPSAG